MCIYGNYGQHIISVLATVLPKGFLLQTWTMCTSVCIHIHTRAPTHWCLHACMHALTHTHTHTYICT